MRKIYGKIGEASQQIGGSHPGEGWAEMTMERPGPDYVAQEDGGWAPSPEPVLLSRDEFVERFEDHEKATIMHTPELTPLALKVLTAPNGIDVTDSTSQEAKAALINFGFTEERLNQIFRLPEE